MLNAAKQGDIKTAQAIAALMRDEVVAWDDEPDELIVKKG